MQINKKNIVFISFFLIVQMVFSLEIAFYDSTSMTNKTGEILFDDNGIVFSGYYKTRRFSTHIETNSNNVFCLVYTVTDPQSDYYSKKIDVKLESLVDSIKMTTSYPKENVNLKMGRGGKQEVEEFFFMPGYEFCIKSENWMFIKNDNIVQVLRLVRGMNHSYDITKQISDRWLLDFTPAGIQS